MFCLLALCAAPALGALPRQEDIGSLVQSAVRLHDTEELPEHPQHVGVNATFLVDNSHLQHNGPGVLLRRSMELADTLGVQHMLEWGSRFKGTVAAEGWVQYQDWFVPMSIHGTPVLTLQAINVHGAKGSYGLKKQRFHYQPTEMRLSSGDWLPCRILSPGRVLDTFTVEVHPKNFAPYTVTSVKRADLAQVRKIREFDPMPQVEEPVKAEPEEPMIHLTVQDATEGNMPLKMYLKSPLRAVMKMACEKVGVTSYKCLSSHVKFTYKGEVLSADSFVQDHKMEDGATIVMTRS